jgi:dihydrodiol dehydrogenase / D-xylose 1-dehydrogenase (NADP)
VSANEATGIATSSMAAPTDGNRSSTAGPAVKIIGTKATITIPHPIYRPTEYTIHPHGEGKKPERHVFEIPGKGMHWQADETARAIRKSPPNCNICVRVS